MQTVHMVCVFGTLIGLLLTFLGCIIHVSDNGIDKTTKFFHIPAIIFCFSIFIMSLIKYLKY